jgi:ABC-type glycerol-3-phosphate transport system substrate-binding protein
VRSLAVLLLAAVALAGCGGDDEQAADTAAAQTSGVKELANVLDLRADFEADAGKPRVIVLFSPT